MASSITLCIVVAVAVASYVSLVAPAVPADYLYANPALNHGKIASNFIQAFASAFNNMERRRTMAKDFFAKDFIVQMKNGTIQGWATLQSRVDGYPAEARYPVVKTISSTAFGGVDARTNRGGFVMLMVVGSNPSPGGPDVKLSFILGPAENGEYKVLRQTVIV